MCNYLCDNSEAHSSNTSLNGRGLPTTSKVKKSKAELVCSAYNSMSAVEWKVVDARSFSLAVKSLLNQILDSL